jgi:hypothetical protein
MKKRKWYKYYVIASWKNKSKSGIFYPHQTEIDEFRFMAREDEWITDVIEGILIKEYDYDYIEDLEIISFSREKV